MANKRRIRLLGGRFADGELHDPLQALAGEVWHSVDRSPESLSAPSTARPANLGTPSPSAGIIDVEEMRNRKALLLGAGAVGCRNSLLLAPYGVTQIAIDHDVVERRNILDGRTPYTESDVGKLKVVALREKIKALHPRTRVVAHPRNVHEISRTELRCWASRSDIALVAIDEGPAIVRLNEVLYAELPVFYQGVHRAGRSGQIIITRPGSPCLKCCMGISSGNDVETLHGMAALGIHFAAIAQLATQLVVQELAARSGSVLVPPLGPDVHVLIVFNAASELTPHGPGIVPFRVERDPGCDICGNQPRRR